MSRLRTGEAAKAPHRSVRVVTIVGCGFSYVLIALLLGRASTYTSPSEPLQRLAGTPHPVPSPAWSRTRNERSAGQREAAPTNEMEDSKRQNRPDEHDRRARLAGDVPDETLTELLSSYTPKQREVFLKGFRILARVAIRAHMERQALGSKTAPNDGGEEEG